MDLPAHVTRRIQAPRSTSDTGHSLASTWNTRKKTAATMIKNNPEHKSALRARWVNSAASVEMTPRIAMKTGQAFASGVQDV